MQIKAGPEFQQCFIHVWPICYGSNRVGKPHVRYCLLFSGQPDDQLKQNRELPPWDNVASCTVVEFPFSSKVGNIGHYTQQDRDLEGLEMNVAPLIMYSCVRKYHCYNGVMTKRISSRSVDCWLLLCFCLLRQIN